MLRNSGSMRLSLGTFNATGGTSRPPAGAEGARRTGASLSQLESVLQRLNKHDERAQIQSVERTSTQTQHKLLKDELLKVQEELVIAHTGKNKLCEQIGALQQAKQDQQTQIEHLLVELRSSRESQAAMSKKVAELERGSEELKRNYIRSLTCRTKTAAELLSRLHGVGSFEDIAASIQTKCEIWVGSDPNKRKRVEEAQAVVVEDCPVDDDPMTGQSLTSTNETPSVVDEHAAGAATTSEEEPEDPPVPQVQECRSCFELTIQKSNAEQAAKKELEVAEVELQKMQGRNSELVKMHDSALAKLSALHMVLSEKDDTIADLKEALQVEKEQVIQAEQKAQMLDDTKENSMDCDSSARIKVLEDNLAQLNTYADHLEMLISQCPSCSVKLQSENTQDSMK